MSSFFTIYYTKVSYVVSASVRMASTSRQAAIGLPRYMMSLLARKSASFKMTQSIKRGICTSEASASVQTVDTWPLGLKTS